MRISPTLVVGVLFLLASAAIAVLPELLKF